LNLVIKKNDYNHDDFFREVKDVPNQEFLPKEKKPNVIEFELRYNEVHSSEE
jgi:hypothetical protein